MHKFTVTLYSLAVPAANAAFEVATIKPVPPLDRLEGQSRMAKAIPPRKGASARPVPTG